ncbi:MAG: hypothetical protein CVU77_01290 [Elusimicrobia bacterium HGW-Elusimicrobia-1]|jgi:hypothetical protein|nr:MAG: hypothetical protein CVU77_01290 [Elusimicrobia bacterium HGW-Elusimicrobia-1]
MKKLFPLIAGTIAVWLLAGALLIYAGNSPAFASVIAGAAALPLWFGRLQSAAAKPARLTAWLDAAWLALFIYALIELFEITSSEVVLTAMLMVLAFSKWKEASRAGRDERPEGEKPQ